MEPDVAHAKLAGDLRETGMIGPGGDADEFQPVGLRGDDPQRAFADGAGGAEEDDAFFV
jgi:hypothetical protein